MGISPASLNSYSRYQYEHIMPPMPDRAAISRGAFRTPSASALAPSNTAYGTNANAALGGPVYIDSAQVLARNSMVNSNVITSRNAIESGNALQEAMNTISRQTPGSRFGSKTGIFSTNKTTPQVQQPTETTNILSSTRTSSNIRTQSPVFESTMALTGRNASINREGAVNMAAVNANLNVRMSQQGAQALQALQNSATIAAMQASNITAKVDGMIPVSAATLSDFSSRNTSGVGNSRLFDNITETFNHIMGGGGHGGGGGALAQPQKEEIQETENKKRLNFKA